MRYLIIFILVITNPYDKLKYDEITAYYFVNVADPNYSDYSDEPDTDTEVDEIDLEFDLDL